MKLGEGSTPGPWNIDGRGGPYNDVLIAGIDAGATSALIAQVSDTLGRADANARLIAHAPLLVDAREALQALVNALPEPTYIVDDGCLAYKLDKANRDARALLAKLEAE